jgi:aspartate/methionine/tyrosine aminotransferase
MRLDEFKLERFFARWEFVAPYVLCASDVEGMSLSELLALADPESRRLFEGLRLGYTETLGHPLLREAIAGLYRGVEREQILVFAGAQEPIFVVMNALLQPGDHVVAVTPCYQSLYSVPNAIGADVTFVPLEAERCWAVDADRIAAALTARTRLIVANFPNSPTGALPDADTFRKLVRLADDRRICFFSDEVYRLLEYDPGARLPAAVELSETAVSLGVMSKAFGLAGLRIGWIATRDRDLFARAASLKHYTTICSSAPSEVLALIALRARERVLERALGIVRPNLERLARFFGEWSAVFDWVPPAAGTVAFPRLRTAASIEKTAEELVASHGVLILPGSLFDHSGNHFRIGLGRSSLSTGLERFEDFLRSRGLSPSS